MTSKGFVFLAISRRNRWFLDWGSDGPGTHPAKKHSNVYKKKTQQRVRHCRSRAMLSRGNTTRTLENCDTKKRKKCKEIANKCKLHINFFRNPGDVRFLLERTCNNFHGGEKILITLSKQNYKEAKSFGKHLNFNWNFGKASEKKFQLDLSEASLAMRRNRRQPSLSVV